MFDALARDEIEGGTALSEMKTVKSSGRVSVSVSVAQTAEVVIDKASSLTYPQSICHTSQLIHRYCQLRKAVGRVRFFQVTMIDCRGCNVDVDGILLAVGAACVLSSFYRCHIFVYRWLQA